MHINVMHDNAIAFMVHQCREVAAVSLLVVQVSNRATSLIGRSLKLVHLSAASVPASYRRRGILMRRGLSVHPAPDNGRPRRRGNRTGRVDGRVSRRDCTSGFSQNSA
jgi:hypothetical protein